MSLSCASLMGSDTTLIVKRPSLLYRIYSARSRVVLIVLCLSSNQPEEKRSELMGRSLPFPESSTNMRLKISKCITNTRYVFKTYSIRSRTASDCVNSPITCSVGVQLLRTGRFMNFSRIECQSRNPCALSGPCVDPNLGGRGGLADCASTRR